MFFRSCMHCQCTSLPMRNALCTMTQCDAIHTQKKTNQFVLVKHPAVKMNCIWNSRFHWRLLCQSCCMSWVPSGTLNPFWQWNSSLGKEQTFQCCQKKRWTQTNAVQCWRKPMSSKWTIHWKATLSIKAPWMQFTFEIQNWAVNEMNTKHLMWKSTKICFHQGHTSQKIKAKWHLSLCKMHQMNPFKRHT